MEESALREHIRQKISEGTLPRDPSVFSSSPVDLTGREARGDPCAVCDLSIHPAQAMTEFRSPLHPNLRFFFHPACEQLWRDEASRLMSRRDDPPAS
jgi:hypothetical protein